MNVLVQTEDLPSSAVKLLTMVKVDPSLAQLDDTFEVEVEKEEVVKVKKVEERILQLLRMPVYIIQNWRNCSYQYLCRTIELFLSYD